MTAEQVTVIVGAIAILGALVTFTRWARPRWRSLTQTLVAIRDTFLGRDAIRDSITGREIEPAQPSMGIRLANVETGLTELVRQDARLTHVEGEIDNLKDDVASLKDARIERVVTQAESAAMLNMVERLHEVDRPDPSA